MGKHKKRNKSVPENEAGASDATSTPIVNSEEQIEHEDVTVVHKKKKKKHHKHLNTASAETESKVTSEISQEETVEVADTETRHKKKKKKKKKSQGDEHDQTTVIHDFPSAQGSDSGYADDQHGMEHGKKHGKKRKKQLEDASTDDESSHADKKCKIVETDINTEHDTTATNGADIEAISGDCKKHWKKKKKKNKASLLEPNDPCKDAESSNCKNRKRSKKTKQQLSTDDVTELNLVDGAKHLGAEVESADFEERAEKIKKKKRHKHLATDNQGDVNLNESNPRVCVSHKEQSLPKNGKDGGAKTEESTAKVKSKKHKKTKCSNYYQPPTCNENLSSIKENPPAIVKADEEGESANKFDADLGQWGTADLGSEDRRAKFLHLLGAGRTNASTSSQPRANSALSRTGEVELNRALENQYESAMSSALGQRGRGLGYVAPPAKNSKFRIDINQSASVKFED